MAGGSRPAGLTSGNYLAATVFADVHAVDADLPGGDLRAGGVRDAVRRLRQEAVALANDTRYGLAAYLWTSRPAPRAPRRRTRSRPG